MTSALRRSFRKIKRQCTLRCKSLPDSSSLDVSSSPVEAIDSESECHHSSVHFCGRAGSVQDITVSSSIVNARLVPRDADVLKVQAGKHALAAVFTAQSSAPTPGLAFLKAKLLLHMQIQARIHAGQASAVAAALATLTSAFQWLPVQADVFQNLDLTLVYINMEDNMVYTGSLGQCSIASYNSSQQDAAGSRQQDSSAQQPATQSFRLPMPRGTQNAQPRTLQAQAFPLDMQIDGIILGSAGFWNEVAHDKALLRLHHHTQQAPTASDHNPALHLTNFALHNVARRHRNREPHPCTPDMSSVAALQSLWVGSADEEGNTPAHIRYRGDVHGDMNVVVVQITHADSRGRSASQALSRSVSNNVTSDYTRAAVHSSRGSSAKQRWAFLRMHFCTFPAASRKQTHQQWHATVAAAQAAARGAAEAEAMKLQAAEAFLFGGSPLGSLLWPQDVIKAFGGDSAECGKDAQGLALRLLRPSMDVAAGV